MNNITSNFLANTYSAFSPAMNMASTICKVNGEEVACPQFLNILGPGIFFFGFVVGVLMIVAMWKIFTKAKQPGWAAIIPVYNLVVLLQITKKPTWWVILGFIPVVNLIIGLIVLHELSKSFGKGIGYTLGLIFLPFIFYPMLAFGSAQYLPDVSVTQPPVPPVPPAMPASTPPATPTQTSTSAPISQA